MSKLPADHVCMRAVAAFNANDPAAFEALFTPGIKRHDLARVIDDFAGREHVSGFLNLLRTALPDLHIEVEDAFATDDRVALRLTFSGTHEGELLGAAPTGKRIAFTGVNLYRLEDGKIAETWQLTDWAGALRQASAS
ncbi:MAG TPA: ester cyclase [Dehalococcoidia bacterium]|nr:ester cyclase [Dehalococcoidia bacterium]